MASNVQQSRQSLSHATQNLLTSYNKRLQDDIHVMVENFSGIIRSAKIEENQQIDRAAQSHYDMYQMQVRAANIVRAGESLLKLISELKTFVILNDFPSINHHIEEQNNLLNDQSRKLKDHYTKLKDEISVALYDLESEYCCSLRPNPPQTSTLK